MIQSTSVSAQHETALQAYLAACVNSLLYAGLIAAALDATMPAIWSEHKTLHCWMNYRMS